MELWFIYALASALLAGMHTFSHKVAVEKGYSSTEINTYNTAVSAVLAFSVFFFEPVSSVSIMFVIALSLVAGITHAIGSIVRMDALKYIDTALFFPLYKMIGPIFTTIIGVIFFSELLNKSEWVGVILGILLPLLLISKMEKKRQKNLVLGLILVMVSAALTAAAASVAKYNTVSAGSVFLFIAIAHSFATVTSIVIGKFSKKKSEVKQRAKHDIPFYTVAIGGGLMQFFGFAAMMLAFSGGSLAIVYTINSFYILIPIVLSVILYKEHMNIRKALAIVLSIVALAFLR